MDIIKIKSKKGRMHFFRNENHSDWYFIKYFSDSNAETFFLCSRHLPPHEESGYMDLAIQWAFAVECENVNEEKYLSYIKNEIGTYREDEEPGITRWIVGNGWYEIKDVSNTARWLNDFYDFQNQRRLELQKTNGSSLQTTLF